MITFKLTLIDSTTFTFPILNDYFFNFPRNTVSEAKWARILNSFKHTGVFFIKMKWSHVALFFMALGATCTCFHED